MKEVYRQTPCDSNPNQFMSFILTLRQLLVGPDASALQWILVTWLYLTENDHYETETETKPNEIRQRQENVGMKTTPRCQK